MKLTWHVKTLLWLMKGAEEIVPASDHKAIKLDSYSLKLEERWKRRAEQSNKSGRW